MNNIKQILYTRIKEGSTRQVNPFVAKLDAFARRAFDIFVSFLGILLLLPLLGFLSFVIKKDSPGPIFYKGWRAGRFNKPFKILKFRTMYEKEESYAGPKVTAHDDQRITPIGHWLRNTKLNELPQLWNVLLGEMSLVGPRPEDVGIVEGWPVEIRDEVLSVRPGITSPASVIYRDEEDLLKSDDLMDRYLWEILPSKLRLDQLYVRYRSTMADLDVLFWTAIALIPRVRKFSIPEHLLYAGPFSIFFHRYLLWFTIDLVVAFLAIGSAGIIFRIGAPLDLGLSVAIPVALSMAMIFSIINVLFGLDRVEWSRAQPADGLTLAISTGLSIIVLFSLNFLVLPERLLPPIMVIVAGSFSFAGFLVVRYRTRLFAGLIERTSSYRSKSIHSLVERVLIIGTEAAAGFAAQLLRGESFTRAFNIVGVVDDNPLQVGMKINGLLVLGSLQDIPDLIKKHDIGIVLFAKLDITQERQESILSEIKKSPAHVIMIPHLMDIFRSYFPSSKGESEEAAKKILRNTTIDPWTGTNKWEHFQKLVEREVNRAERYKHPLSIITFEISIKSTENKKISNTLRSEYIRTAGHQILENLRAIDLVARQKENRFVIVLPETEIDCAKDIAIRLCKTVIKEITTGDSPLDFQLKFGVGEASGQSQQLEEILDQVEPLLI